MCSLQKAENVNEDRSLVTGRLRSLRTCVYAVLCYSKVTMERERARGERRLEAPAFVCGSIHIESKHKNAWERLLTNPLGSRAPRGSGRAVRALCFTGAPSP